MTNEEIGKFSHELADILKNVLVQIAIFDESLDKKIVADLAWIKLVESVSYTEEQRQTANAIIKQTKEAFNMASNSAEEISKQLIELGYVCRKWIEEHEDS